MLTIAGFSLRVCATRRPMLSVPAPEPLTRHRTPVLGVQEDD